jgi:hypothetical protein
VRALFEGFAPTIRKALVPLLAAAWTVAQSLALTHHFSLSQELVQAIYGVVAAVAVYLVPNLNTTRFALIRKALIAAGLALGAVIVQYVATGDLEWSQEFVTAVEGLVTAVFVYWVPNLLGVQVPDVGPPAQFDRAAV